MVNLATWPTVSHSASTVRSAFARKIAFCVANAFRLVCGQVVHDVDVARCRRGNENLLDISLERDSVYRAVEDHGAVMPDSQMRYRHHSLHSNGF